MLKYGFYFHFLRFKILFLFLVSSLKYTKSDDFKVIYISENKYYIITYENIYFYKFSETLKISYTFNETQKIKTDEELNMISIGIFKGEFSGLSNLIIVKNYVYAIKETIYYCNTAINEIQGYSSEIFPLTCTNHCYYIIGIINSNKQLYLYLYKNVPGFCNSYLVYSFSIDNVGSENFSCQLMESPSNGELLTCFYESNNSNEIIANNLYLNISSDQIESLFTCSKYINKAKIIKSVISKDGTKSYVCYITYFNNCECLIYFISNNEWSNYSTYIKGCLSQSSSLFFDYYDLSDDYFLYCYQSVSKIYVLKLNDNIEIKNKYTNDTYEYINNCSQYFLSSLAYDSNNISVFINCDKNIKTQFIGNFPDLPITIDTSILKILPETNYATTIPIISISSAFISTTLLSTSISKSLLIPITIPNFPFNIISTISPPTETIIPSISKTIYSIKSTNISIDSLALSNTYYDYNDREKNKVIIIKEKVNKTKEEIIDNLDNAMKDYEINKIYEILGDDYNIKISPINTNSFENISTYISFLNCEIILRESNKLNSSNILTVYQIELKNHHNQSLINHVEYAIFNENKEKLDLSVCKDEIIEITYQLNTSKINKTKLNYYSELGIDIFNSEDIFFNDICYSYSEKDSDIILRDRVADIFQNYSLCENNCKYDKINLTENTVNCKCSIKYYVDYIIEKPKLAQIIRDSFTDSNIGVMKCYYLVFSIKNKLKNIGFWIFSILVFLHFPLFIYYFIFNITSIKEYIFSEMKKFHYFSYNAVNPIKKTNNNTANIVKNSCLNEIENIIQKDKKKNKVINSSNSLLFLKNKNIINENDISFNNKSKNNTNDLKTKFKNISNKNLLNQKSNNLLKNRISLQQNISLINNKNKNHIKTIGKKGLKRLNSKKRYSLIQIDANNSRKITFQNSDIILDIYDYETAINYDKRKFCRIFYISILAKENIINIFFFRTPLDILPLRICLFIFTNSCDLAFNTIFYSNENISEKYHYKGKSLFLFSIINNLIQCIISSIVGFLLVKTFQHLIDFRGNLEEIFRNEEKKLRQNKNYKINKERKLKILDKIKKIIINLKFKIFLFINFEFIFMLFFYYFATAFCEVYIKTQISWLYDFFISFLISLVVEILFALVIALFYILSIKYKLKNIFKITLFLYNL